MQKTSFDFQLLAHAASPRWADVKTYAESCSWRAGKQLAQEMDQSAFTNWERVIVALSGERIAGFCTVAKTDCIPNLPYTPYIGYVFVDEAFRGQRLSAQMIDLAAAYLKTCSFDRVHLVSDHVNLYEKYGFTALDRKRAAWGSEETIYMRKL